MYDGEMTNLLGATAEEGRIPGVWIGIRGVVADGAPSDPAWHW